MHLCAQRPENTKGDTSEMMKPTSSQETDPYKRVFGVASTKAAPSQEPVVKVSDVMMIWRLMNSGAMVPNSEEGWLAALEPFHIAAPSQEYDINKCPGCGGEADNGHDREVPPNPYYCTKCEAAPSQEKFDPEFPFGDEVFINEATPSQEIEMPKPIPNLTIPSDWAEPSQEPVAWKWRRNYPNNCWTDGVEKQRSVAENRLSGSNDCELIPLYAHPSDAAAQIAEKDEAIRHLTEAGHLFREQIAKLEARIKELEAPSQEPVAWMYQEYTRKFIGFNWFDEVQFVQPPNEPDLFRNITPLYTTPPDAAAQIAKLEARINELDGQLCYINCPNCGELAGQNESIINKKLAAAEKDAARYRWLRTCPNNLSATLYGMCGLDERALKRDDYLDAAIDATMKLSAGDTAGERK